MNVMGYVWGRELAQTRPERLLQRVLLTHSGLSVVLGDSGAVCDPCPVSPGTLEVSNSWRTEVGKYKVHKLWVDCQGQTTGCVG